MLFNWTDKIALLQPTVQVLLYIQADIGVNSFQSLCMFLFCDMFLWRHLFTNFCTLKWVDSELVYYTSSSG